MNFQKQAQNAPHVCMSLMKSLSIQKGVISSHNMIIDVLKNLEKYSSLHFRFKKAFEFIQSTDFLNLPCGRYEIDGENIYANVEQYLTKTESKVEYHKKYIDIQLVTKGVEKIGYCNISEIKNPEEFNSQKDIGFATGEVSFVEMSFGKFMILFPEDAHQPCMAIDEPKNVKKVVVKVKID